MEWLLVAIIIGAYLLLGGAVAEGLARNWKISFKNWFSIVTLWPFLMIIGIITNLCHRDRTTPTNSPADRGKSSGS